MRALIIYNPKAGSAQGNSDLATLLQSAADIWRNAGWEVDLAPTASANDGTRLAREAAEKGYDLAVAAGGDGTINDVVNGLAGTQTALATLPLGTVNVWARELSMPLNILEAAEAMLEWSTYQIDLGRAGDRYFLLMAGIGFDAAVSAAVRSDVKRRIGALAYIVHGLQVALRVRGTRARLALDGRRLRRRILQVVVGNSQLYGGLVKITPHALIDDGMLDICVIKGDSFLSALVHVFSLIAHSQALNPEIEYYRVRSMTISTRTPLPVQIDGDTIGRTPMLISVVPGALRVLMPFSPS